MWWCTDGGVSVFLVNLMADRKEKKNTQILNQYSSCAKNITVNVQSTKQES
jgi:hypothetical protein